jgi:cytochrome c oxidase cbb3-type subunit 3
MFRVAQEVAVSHRKLAGLVLFCLLIGSSPALPAQTGNGSNATIEGTKSAIQGSHEDPAAVARGETLYQANCGSCHGMTAKGTDHASDLIRSNLLIDDEKGNLLAPVIRDGKPDQGMPKSNLTDDQISDVVAWLHVQFYAADHRNTYSFLDALTGDPKRGEAYFNGSGKCTTCHSATGDLAGIGSRFDAHALQQRWLQPRAAGVGRGGRGRGGDAAAAPDVRGVTTVTVTLPGGQTVSGTLDRVDDFFVSLRDADGNLRTFARDGDIPKVVINDPLKVHTDMLRTYTDAEIHDITAYLVTLK